MIKVIKEFKKNSREVVRLEFTEYQGKNLFNIRVWYKDGENDELKPSKKGIAIKAELISDLKDAVIEAEAFFNSENNNSK